MLAPPLAQETLQHEERSTDARVRVCVVLEWVRAVTRCAPGQKSDGVEGRDKGASGNARCVSPLT